MRSSIETRGYPVYPNKTRLNALRIVELWMDGDKLRKSCSESMWDVDSIYGGISPLKRV